MMKKRRPKDESPLKTVFSDDEITTQWVCSLRDDTVIPSFIGMAEHFEMTPDAQVTSINYVEGADEHAMCKVLTIFEPHLKSKEDSKIETIIRKPVDDSKAAIEVQVIKRLNLVAVITYINGFCIEMRYHRISKAGKISKSTCFIADDKEDNDEWLIKQRDRAIQEAKSEFVEEVMEGVKEGKYPIVHKDDLEEIMKLVREKAENRANESQKPKGHTNNRIKFYDN
jgi:hypothetical protein